MHKKAHRPTPQLGSHTLSLIAPLSSFHPLGPYPAGLVTNTSLLSPSPFSNQVQLAKAQRADLPPPHSGGRIVPSGKSRQPETHLGSRQKAWSCGRKCWDPHRVFVFLAAPDKPDPSKGLRK